MIINTVGIFFVVVGTVVSLIFWVPGFINKNHLRQIMGPRYPIVYFVYFSNGPLLLIIGTVMLTCLRG